MAATPAVHSHRGKNSYQHDRSLVHVTPRLTMVAVADGHGSSANGHLVSEHIVSALEPTLARFAVLESAVASPPDESALRAASRVAVAALDKSCIALTSAKRLYAGSTLCAVIRPLTPVPHVVCLNVGDSRAVLVRLSPDGMRNPQGHALSVDHDCDAPHERERIERAGGIVIGGLLNGYISMSRALGDNDLKAHRNLTQFTHCRPGVVLADSLFTGVPDVSLTPLRADDALVIVASDGLWGKVSNADAASTAARALADGADAHAVAEALVRRALARGSRDNVTAAVDFLQPAARLHATARAQRTASGNGVGALRKATTARRRPRRAPSAGSEELGGGGGGGTTPGGSSMDTVASDATSATSVSTETGGGGGARIRSDMAEGGMRRLFTLRGRRVNRADGGGGGNTRARRSRDARDARRTRSQAEDVR